MRKRKESGFWGGLRFEIGLIEIERPLRVERRPGAKLILIWVKETNRHDEKRRYWQIRTFGRYETNKRYYYLFYRYESIKTS